MRELTDIAAGIFGTTSGLIFSKRKDRKTADARRSLIYFFVTEMGAKISYAARSVGLNHSTGQHAMKTIYGLLEANREFRIKYNLFHDAAIKISIEGTGVKSIHKIILCDIITSELFGFTSMRLANEYMLSNKNRNYAVYEKKML